LLVIAVTCSFARKVGQAALFFSNAASYLGQWTVDLTTGDTKAEQLSELPSEICTWMDFR
jgi:hypothetical protein